MSNHGGWKLAAYQWESETYPAFERVKVSREEADKLLRKFARHFKTSCPTLSYKLKRYDGAGHYVPNFGYPRIVLGKNPTLSVICHEYAHHLEFVRWNTKKWHGKKFKRELKRVYTFAKRYLPDAGLAGVEPAFFSLTGRRNTIMLQPNN